MIRHLQGPESDSGTCERKSENHVAAKSLALSTGPPLYRKSLVRQYS